MIGCITYLVEAWWLLSRVTVLAATGLATMEDPMVKRATRAEILTILMTGE